FTKSLKIIGKFNNDNDANTISALLTEVINSRDWDNLSEKIDETILSFELDTSKTNLLFFGGFPGHAMMYQVSKSEENDGEFFVDVVNTGSGVVFHEEIDDFKLSKSRKYSDTIRFRVHDAKDLGYILNELLKHQSP